LLHFSCRIAPGWAKAIDRNLVVQFARVMPVEDARNITGLLAEWSKGDEKALECLVPLVYPELRRLARLHLFRRAPHHSLDSAALANEAYLKLIRSHGVQCQNRLHFFALCAQVMRRILVDHARSRRVAKRGGEAVRVPLDEKLLGTRARGVEVVDLDDALLSLSKLDPRKSRVVELRYFGGLSVEETAEVLQISAETVMRDWQMAKTWLFRELTRTSDPARRIRTV